MWKKNHFGYKLLLTDISSLGRKTAAIPKVLPLKNIKGPNKIKTSRLNNWKLMSYQMKKTNKQNKSPKIQKKLWHVLGHSKQQLGGKSG